MIAILSGVKKYKFIQHEAKWMVEMKKKLNAYKVKLREKWENTHITAGAGWLQQLELHISVRTWKFSHQSYDSFMITVILDGVATQQSHYTNWM